MYMQKKLKNWASAIVYLVAQLNCMFDNLIFETLGHEDIEDFFRTKSTFYIQLAIRIDKKLYIRDIKTSKLGLVKGICLIFF